MFGQLASLATGLVGITTSIMAFGWLIQYAFSEEMAEAEEKDEVELDDDNI